MSHALRSVHIPAYVLAVSAGLVLGDGPQRLAAVAVALVLVARVLLHRHGAAVTHGSAPFVPAHLLHQVDYLLETADDLAVDTAKRVHGRMFFDARNRRTP
mgnify:CR=1 FL=1